MNENCSEHTDCLLCNQCAWLEDIWHCFLHDTEYDRSLYVGLLFEKVALFFFFTSLAGGASIASTLVCT